MVRMHGTENGLGRRLMSWLRSWRRRKPLENGGIVYEYSEPSVRLLIGLAYLYIFIVMVADAFNLPGDE